MVFYQIYVLNQGVLFFHAISFETVLTSVFLLIIGLLGDATEDMVDNLDSDKGILWNCFPFVVFRAIFVPFLNY